MKEQIRDDDVRHFAAVFDGDPKNRLALNAVTKNGIAPVALNRTVVNQVDHTYS